MARNGSVLFYFLQLLFKFNETIVGNEYGVADFPILLNGEQENKVYSRGSIDWNGCSYFSFNCNISCTVKTNMGETITKKKINDTF